MVFFVALLIFILVYVVVGFLLRLVDKLQPVAEVLAIVVGIMAALFYVGVIK